jgi:hypothetical protein
VDIQGLGEERQAARRRETAVCLGKEARLYGIVEHRQFLVVTMMGLKSNTLQHFAKDYHFPHHRAGRGSSGIALILQNKVLVTNLLLVVH